LEEFNLNYLLEEMTKIKRALLTSLLKRQENKIKEKVQKHKGIRANKKHEGDEKWVARQ
jgi:hypothetical protein